MSIEDIVHARVTPYSATLKRFDWWGSTFIAKQLAFTMQMQTETNWCWAATSNSVSHFYWFRSRWTQCTIVNGELVRNDACTTPAPSDSNIPWFLDRALTRTNNFVSKTVGTATFAHVRAEIDAGHPVGARIGWSGGGGHFVVIYGYSTWFGEEYLDIDDPINGKSHLTLSDFSTNYRGTGTWTHFYITKSYTERWWPDYMIPEHLIKQIWQARQVMQLKDAIDPERLVEAEQPQDAQFGLAHRTYSLGLDQLLSGKDVEPGPVGLRVYETRDGRPVAFYDVDEADEGAVRSMSKARGHLDAFTAAVGAAKHVLPREGDASADARLLTVPALNFEALWLVTDGGPSVAIPLLPAAGLEVGQTYPLDEALEALREAARPLADMDDEMGA